MNGTGNWATIIQLSAADGASNATFSGDVIVRKGKVVRIEATDCRTKPDMTWDLGTNPCTVVGTPGNDTLRGTSGDDELCGLGGDDTFIATQGEDAYWGGSGSDTVSFENSPVAVDSEGESHWSNYGQPGGKATAGTWSVAHYINIENVRGSRYDDRISDSDSYPQECSSCDVGADTANVFIGGPGNDVLEGGGAPDALFGWAGDDTLVPGSDDGCGSPRGPFCGDFHYATSLADGGQGNDHLDLTGWNGCQPNVDCGDSGPTLTAVGIEHVQG